MEKTWKIPKTTGRGSEVRFEEAGGVLLLKITDDMVVRFQREWIEGLRDLPIDRYGEYLRGNVYPHLTSEDQKTWCKASISNRDLEAAVKEFR